MNDRSTNLKSIRPIIANAKVNPTMSADECFQNATLRPIIKMQNHLLIMVFKNYISKRKNVFYDLALPKQLAYIDQSINKDMKFRNSIKGMIIGQFTVEEYEMYIQNSSALNKRMMNIVKERLVNNIQVFSQPLAKAI
nr:glyoxalase [uncultured Psychroserpens sp.]